MNIGDLVTYNYEIYGIILQLDYLPRVDGALIYWSDPDEPLGSIISHWVTEDFEVIPWKE